MQHLSGKINVVSQQGILLCCIWVKNAVLSCRRQFFFAAPRSNSDKLCLKGLWGGAQTGRQPVQACTGDLSHAKLSLSGPHQEGCCSSDYHDTQLRAVLHAHQPFCGISLLPAAAASVCKAHHLAQSQSQQHLQEGELPQLIRLVFMPKLQRSFQASGTVMFPKCCRL